MLLPGETLPGLASISDDSAEVGALARTEGSVGSGFARHREVDFWGPSFPGIAPLKPHPISGLAEHDSRMHIYSIMQQAQPL